MTSYLVTAPDRTFTFRSKRNITHAVAVLYESEVWTVINFSNRLDRVEQVARAERAAGYPAHVIEVTEEVNG